MHWYVNEPRTVPGKQETEPHQTLVSPLPALISIPEEGRGCSAVIFMRYDAKLYSILQVWSHML